MDNLLNFIKRMKRLGLLFAFIVFGLTVLAQSEYVDLGLPSGTYWKKGNVGGDSYIYRKSNYYYTYQEAVKKFGNNLPTKEQYDELLKYCKWERNLKDNDNGYRVVGPNGNFIIMERVGYRTIAGYVTDVEWHAQYWTSTPNDSEAWGFCIFGFNYHLCSCSKNEGHAVRLVISKEEAKKIRQKEREQYRIADCIAREEKRVADSIARERRIADSLEREEKIRQHNLDKEHDAEILQSLSGVDEFTITKEFAEKINKLYRTKLSFKCYNNGLAEVFNGEGVGFINKNGDVVIPIQYDYVRPLSDGLAVVADKEGHYGAFDSLGNIVIPFRYNHIEDFGSGVAWARMGELWGVIDKMGNTVVPFQYSWTYDFYDGVAWVSKNGKLSVIDTKGNIVFDASQYEAFYPFHNGYAWVKKEGRWGLIDKHGKIVIPFSSKQYEEYGFLQDGLIWAKDKQSKYGVIDLRGNIVIPFVYSDFSYFENGSAWAYKNNKWGIINRKGNTIIPFQYNFACDFLARPAYRPVTQYVYLRDLYETEFKDSVAAIKKGDKWGFTNMKGKILVPFQYDIASFDNGLYWVEKDGKEGMIDENGNFITQSRVQYKNIGNYNGKMKILGYSESLYLVEYYTTHNGRHITFSGFMDKNGNCTITEDIIELQIKN